MSANSETVPIARSPARRGRALPFFIVSGLALVLCGILSVSIGTIALDGSTVLRVVSASMLPDAWVGLDGIDEAARVIVWEIRLPRTIVAIFVGGALAVSGTLMQGLFRNPLAEPNVIGTSSGGALGAVVAFALGLTAQSVYWLPFAAFTGCWASLVTVYRIATRDDRTPVATLLLSGIALGALMSAVSSLLITVSFADWRVAAEIVFWLMGGLDSRTWDHVGLSAPLIVLGVAAAIPFSRELDILLTGEEVAASLGVEVERVKRVLFGIAALLTGAAVAVSGVLGFVGLVVPHMVRILLGPGHRTLIPACFLGGGVFLVLCDLLARTAASPSEVRLGIVTAVFGAPFFLYLLRRHRRETGYS